MVIIRLISLPDHLELPHFHAVVCAILGWTGDLAYILRIHGQECNSFRRKTRSKARATRVQLHRQEKFLYICDTLHLWEWDIRVLDIREGAEEDHASICLGGRGAAPPEFCGGKRVTPHYAIRVCERLGSNCWRKHARRNRQGLGIFREAFCGKG